MSVRATSTVTAWVDSGRAAVDTGRRQVQCVSTGSTELLVSLHNSAVLRSPATDMHNNTRDNIQSTTATTNQGPDFQNFLRRS